jgi:hypothetical protein
VDAAALAMESSIRNSLGGSGSFEKTKLDYNTVGKNIESALSQTKNVSQLLTTGSKWTQVKDSLVSAQKNMISATTNKGTDDAAGKARSAAFLAAKSDLTKAESMMNSLGYDKGKKITL